MEKPKKPKAASLVAAAFLITMLLSVAAVLLNTPGRQGPDRAPPPKRTAGPPAIVPPARTQGAVSSPSLSSRKAAARRAWRCLNGLCDTGASGAALSETRGLAAQLDALPQTPSQGLSAVLKSVLAFRDRSGTGFAAPPIPSFPGLSRDLFRRAAAACDARGRRRQGEIVLTFAGDCTFGTVNGDDSGLRFPSVYRRSGRKDYPFDLMKPWFLNDDLTIVNFECTLTDAARTADKEWKFKGNARYAWIFPAGSVEAVGLSNNHSFDYLQAGFDDTVRNFRKAHVPVFYQNAPYVTTLQGVETILIGDCTVVGENTTVTDGVLGRVISEIKRYKKPGDNSSP